MSFVVADWIGCYPLRWILEAIVEALYQGRYKTISVEQILIIWQRRGCPLHHFNGEFERIVCRPLLDAASDNAMETPQEDLSQRSLSQSDREQYAASESIDSGTPGAEKHHLKTAPLEKPFPDKCEKFDTKDRSQETDYIGNDYLGKDGRLSELLVDDPAPQNSYATTSSTFNSLSGRALAQSRAKKQALPLKQWGPERHKLPVSIFEPLETQSTRSPDSQLELQQLTGTTVRNYPIHQFTPSKASPTIYKKLRAIAHSYQ